MINKEKWRDLNIKDKIQYITAIILFASGIILAFISFFILFNITSGVLLYISEAFICGASIFGVSLYFKTKLGEFKSERDSIIESTINKMINKINDGNTFEENSKET